MSAIRPTGIMSAAVARVNDVATQPDRMASIENSLVIEGSATGIEVAIRGVTKEANMATNKTTLLLAFFSEVSAISGIIPDITFETSVQLASPQLIQGLKSRYVIIP